MAQVSERHEAYEKMVAARKISKIAENNFLIYNGWAKVREEGNDVRWYHKGDGSVPQEDAVRLALHFYRSELSIKPECGYCGIRGVPMEKGDPVIQGRPRCIAATACQARIDVK